MPRTILHIDMNNFYASVECLYHPELRGKPLAVCGDPEARHGIVLAKNYLAKACGIKTGNPIWMARQLYADYTDLVEPYGLDECWIDVTGSTRLFGDGKTIADTIRQRVKDEMGVTVSVGVSFNKVFAKLGSDYKKPDATTVIPEEGWQEMVWPLPVDDLLYVGPATAKMRSITTLDLQYAHRFYGFKGEAQYLHGHTGVLTMEVEDSINDGVNMVFPCNEIQKTAWDVLKNFDHALILREDDPLLPAILGVYEKQGIKDGAPQNQMKGEAFKTELATAYPDCRLVVTKEAMPVEGMIKIVYDLLKDKLNIAKLTFTSGVNAASVEFQTDNQIDPCPLCGIALDENGVCPKCGYRK